jgi:copper chaperone CopZ
MHANHERRTHGDRTRLDGWHRLNVPLRALSCGGAGEQISKRLKRIPGVILADINPVTERATVVFDPNRCDPDRITEALATNGSASGIDAFATWQLELGQGQLRQPWGDLELSLQTIIGVREATVDPRTGTLIIRYAPGLSDIAAICRLIEQYLLTTTGEESWHSDHEPGI